MPRYEHVYRSGLLNGVYVSGARQSSLRPVNQVVIDLRDQGQSKGGANYALHVSRRGVNCVAHLKVVMVL